MENQGDENHENADSTQNAISEDNTSDIDIASTSCSSPMDFEISNTSEIEDGTLLDELSYNSKVGSTSEDDLSIVISTDSTLANSISDNNESLEIADVSNGSSHLMNTLRNVNSETDQSRNESGRIVNTILDMSDTESNETEYELSSPNEDAAANDEVPMLSRLLELLRNRSANETVNGYFIVNEIEMLLGILKIADHYSLPFSFVEDICKLFNSFLDKPVLPASKYKLDRLCNPGTNIEYHGVCSECGSYIREFSKSERQLHCDLCQQNIEINSFYRDFFIVLDVKSELKYLLENNYQYYENKINNLRENEDVQEDFCHGRKYRDFVNSLHENDESFITVTFNSDGAPVWKSSKCSIWPIQLNVNELPPQLRNRSTLIQALWFGRDKPRMDIYLKPFVESMNALSENGFVCRIRDRNTTIKVFPLCCCVDSIARAPMQGMIQFNGKYGCSWCLHPGVQVKTKKGGSARKYPLLAELPRNRTQEETLVHIDRALNSDEDADEENSNTYGMKSATPLMLLEHFNIISGVVPDAMHCVDLGVVRQFSELWFNTTKEQFSISRADMNRMDKLIKNLKVPTELARLSRSIQDRKFWKAKEWQNWLLYYSLPILKEIPRFRKYVDHWSKIVQASHILLSNAIERESLISADNLLKQFVAETEILYSKSAMTYNVHQLIHLGKSVLDWGPLWSHSGYPFENGNGILVKKVHAANGVISQICRSLSMLESYRIIEQHVTSTIENSPVLEYCRHLDKNYTKKCIKLGENRYFGKPKDLLELPIDDHDLQLHLCKSYSKIMLKECIFKSCMKSLRRSDNSFAQSGDGRYYKVEQFLITHDYAEYTLCYEVEIMSDFSHICSSMKRVDYIANEVSIIETNTIQRICVYMEINDKKYICAVPNMYNFS